MDFNPRRDQDNLATILIWHPRLSSPDENPFRNPEDCVRDLLSRSCGSDGRKLAETLLADKHALHYMRLVQKNSIVIAQTRRGRDGFWEDQLSWFVDEGKAPADGAADVADDLIKMVADQTDALKLLKRFVPLRTVYVLDHSCIRYSTKAFGDSWDSGACGIAFIDPDVDIAAEGLDQEGLLKAIDAEVAEYDAWANGELEEDENADDGTIGQGGENPSACTDLHCPRCGNTSTFTASSIALAGPISITSDGWDWSQGNSAEFLETTNLTCCECGFQGNHSKFA